MKPLFLAIFVFFISQNLSAEVITKEFDAGKIEFLELKNTSGRIVIKGTDAEKAKVLAEKIKVTPNCEIRIENRETTLFIDIHDGSWIKKENCVVDLDITLPKKVSMDIRSGSGKITINDTDGKIDLLTGSSNVDINAQAREFTGRLSSGNLTINGNIGNTELRSSSGNVKINGTIGKSSIRSGSGNIEIKGLSDTAEIFTGSGNITVQYPKIENPGELNIRSGSGNATVFLPTNSKIVTDFETGSGRLLNEVGDTENPVLKIAFRSGSGDLKIKKTK